MSRLWKIYAGPGGIFSTQEGQLVAVGCEPKEMAQAVSSEELVLQYRRLQDFVRELASKADCSLGLPLLDHGYAAPHRLNHFEGLEVHIGGQYIVVPTRNVSASSQIAPEALQCAREAISEAKEGKVLKAKCLRGLRVHVRGMCKCVTKACIRGCCWGTVVGVRMNFKDTTCILFL